jgi:N-acyl-D-aspartate/D-glutamate deacylase
MRLADGRVGLLVPGPDGLHVLTAAGPLPLGIPGRAAWPGDLDDDGAVDVVALDVAGGAVALRAFMADGAGGFSPREIDVAALGASAAAFHDLTLVDRDHDGDLDLFWCWSATQAAGCAIGTNDGAGGVAVRPSSEHGFVLPGTVAGPVRVAFSDLDNDRDVDLLAAGSWGLALFSNLRDGSFGDVTSRFGAGAAPAATSLAVADMDKDGFMDLLAAADELTLLRGGRGRFEREESFAGTRSGSDLIVLDYDNDGFLDLATSGSGGTTLVRNTGAGGFVERDARVGGATAGATGGAAPDLAAPLAAFDADGDGDLELAAWEQRGQAQAVVLYDNGGAAGHHWIRLESRGVGDNRFGIGAKVEVLAGALRQKFEITDPAPLHVGLGPRETVQSVRYLWPSGVLQDEIELQPGRAAEIAQLDRKGTSCPLLYAWRGGSYRFVTDFLGGAAIGYQLAPGVFGMPDTDEVVRIEGGLEEDASGGLRLRVNNQLEEVLWFDRLELLAVDHPAGTVVYPNERLMPGPPFPELRFYASADVRPIASARGVESGRDLTDLLRAADRRFVDDFALLPPKGYAEPHTLELDLGPLPAGRRVVLLLDGWIDYADSSSNLAAHQAGLRLVPPRLRFADGRGGFGDAVERMGFPAGLPKTMTVELTDRWPGADHRLRIETNMRIYWDRARVMSGGEEVVLQVERLRPQAAMLRDGGFPRESSADGRPPFGYDPHDVEARRSWKAHVGAYTAFGDVTALVSTLDDRFVTTRNGDEIELLFASPGAPAPGRERTYFLYADGFGKDMDPNSAASEEVGPIPFHGMPAYPYPREVVPPLPAAEAGPATPRRVLPSPHGWPGALPQPLVGEAGDLDLLVRGGTLVDGTGGAPRGADVGVRDGRIVAIGDLAGRSAARTIDAHGLAVAPGFIDMHSHADAILLAEPATQRRLLGAKIAQGVTTVIVGNCGLGVVPRSARAAATLAGVNGWMTPDGVTIAGEASIGDYLDTLETQGVALNVGTLVPHGPVRASVMGLAPGEPAPPELDAMRAAVERGLMDGAFGLSVGLIYPPGMYSPTGELMDLARVVARHDGLFAAHVRGSSETLIPATRELIEIARSSDCRVHHSHLEAVGERFWPRVAEVLALEDRARAEGERVSHDVFPYTRAATMMSAIFPPWALEGGVDALTDRLADPASRERLRHELTGRVPEWPPWQPGGWPHNLVGAVGWDGIRIASVAPDGPGHLVGKSLADAGAAEGREPFDVVADLLRSQRGRVGQLVDEISGRDERIDTLLAVLRHPAAAVISDAEDYGRGAPHPAHAGAFARALRLAREHRLMSLEEMVHRMTGRAAALLGLDDRGVVRAGAAADLVVFDPETVGDRATWEEPRRRAEGIPWVVINGTVAVDRGRDVSGLAGRVLRASEPSLAPEQYVRKDGRD